MTVAHVFMRCSSVNKSKRTMLKRHGNRWNSNINIDMKNLQALMFLCEGFYEGFIGGPVLASVSIFKSH